MAAANDPVIKAVQSENWIKVQSVNDSQKLLILLQTTKLDLGECAAFVLAEKIKADRLLLDDLAARRVALARGLPVIGTIGILLIAKQQGLISSIKQVLNDLIANGTRISQRLYQDALTIAGDLTDE